MTTTSDAVRSQQVGVHQMLPEWQRDNAALCEEAMLALIERSKSFRELAFSAALPGRKLRGSLALRYTVWADLPQEGAARQVLLAGLARAELLHAASCILDDIIDGDQVRRGRHAFHVRAGLPQAVLTAQELIAIACSVDSAEFDGVERRVQDAILRSVRSTLVGEACDSFPLEQTLAANTPAHDLEALYLLKTTPGFALAHELIGLAHGMDSEELAAVTRYGAALGAYYQYANDYYDWFCIESSVRGNPDDSVLVSLCIPTILALDVVPKARTLVGHRVRRRDFASFCDELVAAGIRGRVRSALDAAAARVWRTLPIATQPAELDLLLRLVDSRDFWGYNYSV